MTCDGLPRKFDRYRVIALALDGQLNPIYRRGAIAHVTHTRALPLYLRVTLLEDDSFVNLAKRMIESTIAHTSTPIFAIWRRRHPGQKSREAARLTGCQRGPKLIWGN